MNDMPCEKQVRIPALRFHGDLIQLMEETCQGFLPTCQCQEAPNDSFGNRPEMGKACGPNSPFSVKLFSLFDHFITPWELEVLTYSIGSLTFKGLVIYTVTVYCGLGPKLGLLVKKAPSLARNQKFVS